MLSKILAVATIVAGAAFGGTSGLARTALSSETEATCTGKPEVVAQRNDAMHELRDAWHANHMDLVALRHGGADVDHQALNELVKDADGALRERLTTALDDVAALTLGRNGLLSDTGEAEDTGEVSDSEEGRPCDVPAPAADQAALDTIVSDAIADMQDIANQANGDVADLPALQHGSSGEHGKPDTAGGGRPESPGKSGEHRP